MVKSHDQQLLSETLTLSRTTTGWGIMFLLFAVCRAALGDKQDFPPLLELEFDMRGRVENILSADGSLMCAIDVGEIKSSTKHLSKAKRQLRVRAHLYKELVTDRATSNRVGLIGRIFIPVEEKGRMEDEGHLAEDGAMSFYIHYC